MGSLLSLDFCGLRNIQSAPEPLGDQYSATAHGTHRGCCRCRVGVADYIFDSVVVEETDTFAMI